MTAFLNAADLTIDHVTVAGSHLKAMQASLAAVGIASQFGGAHSNHATQMALTSFPDGSYLELIALQDNPDPKAVAAHEWSRQLREDAGPAAWAARPRDFSGELERLRAKGIKVGDPVRNGRKRPDGTQLEWETARVGEEPNGTFFPFLIHDFTSRDARAYPSGHPTTTEFHGVTRVFIAVRDVKAAAARYRQAYGIPVWEKDDAAFGAHLAWFGPLPVVLASPLSPDSWLARRIQQFGEGPCAFVLARTAGPRTQLNITWANTEKLGWHLGIEE